MKAQRNRQVEAYEIGNRWRAIVTRKQTARDKALNDGGPRTRPASPVNARPRDGVAVRVLRPARNKRPEGRAEYVTSGPQRRRDNALRAQPPCPSYYAASPLPLFLI
ncbi:hypothetical protein EVAR_68997_1 [Eumeta japonica]|uniref:Uncharacterized protein n=1 Tax=Eumeta variegata TaxID=151549 RepID=A0A4C2A7D6_EUMVA|nr:hypothetical protein EVAR_68997_1 [Eumeta japonica]